VSRALGHPALQALGAAGALLLFTWPFVVQSQPIDVVTSLFVGWFLVVAALFALSRAGADRPASNADPDDSDV